MALAAWFCGVSFLRPMQLSRSMRDCEDSAQSTLINTVDKGDSAKHIVFIASLRLPKLLDLVAHAFVSIDFTFEQEWGVGHSPTIQNSVWSAFTLPYVCNIIVAEPQACCNMDQSHYPCFDSSTLKHAVVIANRMQQRIGSNRAVLTSREVQVDSEVRMWYTLVMSCILNRSSCRFASACAGAGRCK